MADKRLKHVPGNKTTVCKKGNATPMKSMFYRRVFCNYFNISFHAPEKTSLQCELYKQEELIGNVNEEEKKKHEAYIKRKERDCEEKMTDKSRGVVDPSVHVTFDLEAVTSTPSSLVSQVYYKRKPSSYNLSVYSQVPNRVRAMYGINWKEVMVLVK